MIPTNDNRQQVNRFKELDVELDGTFKRGGIPISQFRIKDVFDATDKEFRQFAGQKFKRTAVSGASNTISAADYFIAVTSLALAPTIGLPLPSLVGAGKTFVVKDEVGGAATTTITVTSAGEKNIDGSSSTTLTANYQSKSFYTDGANWFTY